MNLTKYIQGCADNVNQIMPVTLFLVMLYNACFTYQDDNSENLLIRALNGFDLGSTVDDKTFMNTFGEFWKGIAKPDCNFERHLNLLLLVKTKSQIDNLWVSFVEGLHWHAAMITCLLCTKFDYSSNKIQPGSLDIQDFKNARVPHFKDPGVTPKEHLKLTISGELEAKMLKSTFNVQAYIPKKLTGNIDE